MHSWSVFVLLAALFGTTAVSAKFCEVPMTPGTSKPTQDLGLSDYAARLRADILNTKIPGPCLDTGDGFECGLEDTPDIKVVVKKTAHIYIKDKSKVGALLEAVKKINMDNI